jgi:hypothetical protein
MCSITVTALPSAFFVAPAKAIRALVVVEEPELSQKAEGIVVDPWGANPRNAVTDRAKDGVAVLRRPGYWR